MFQQFHWNIFLFTKYLCKGYTKYQLQGWLENKTKDNTDSGTCQIRNKNVSTHCTGYFGGFYENSYDGQYFKSYALLSRIRQKHNSIFPKAT